MKQSGARVLRSQAVDSPRAPLSVLDDVAAVERALLLAQHDAIRIRLGTGVPITTWRNGQMVEVPAEELAAELGLL